MAKNSRQSNLAKLIRNKNNIMRNYVKVDNKLLETIINEDRPSFIEQVGQNSTDKFLVNVLPEYPEFADELFDIIQNENQGIIDRLKIEKKELAKLPQVKKKGEFAPSLEKPLQLKAKKNNRQSWNKQEENKIKILIKSGKKPKEIRTKINELRLSNNTVLRTDSSINNKINRIKKKR